MTADPRVVEDFLPTLQEARRAGLTLAARVWWRMGLEIDLLGREPTDMRQVAAICVRGRVLRRRRLAQRTEIPAQSAHLVPDRPPPPPSDYRFATTTIVTDVSSGPRRCSHCHEGKINCAVCLGRGFIEVRDSSNDAGRQRGCPSCRRVGTHDCSHCRGTAETVEARCVDIIDEVMTLAYPYVPTMSFALEEKVTLALEAELATAPAVPGCLHVDSEPQKSGGPYRQAVREPEFRGFSYGNALSQARSALAGIRGEEPLLEEVEIHARPILWLRYEAWGTKREVALFFALDGTLHAAVGDGGI